MVYSRQYFRFDSHVWHQELEVLHFGDSGYPLLLFPAENGRFFDPEDKGLIAGLRPYIDRGDLQVFCLETRDFDTFFAPEIPISERRQRWLALERHWTQEFIPYACEVAQNDFLVVAGCSLGATHALNLTLRHPRLVRRCIAISGPYDLANTLPLFAEFSQSEREQELYFVSPMSYMANMNRQLWREFGGDSTDIKLLSAQDDHYVRDSQQLSEIMGRNGISHHLEVWSGGNDWSVWSAQLAAFA